MWQFMKLLNSLTLPVHASFIFMSTRAEKPIFPSWISFCPMPVLHRNSHVWDKSLGWIHGLHPSCLSPGSHGSRGNSKQTAESDVTNLGLYPGLNNRCMFYCCLFHWFSFYWFFCLYQSYPFVPALSPDLWAVPLVQTVAAVPLSWAAGGSAKEFCPSNFSISLCILPSSSFTFSTLKFCTNSLRNARNPFQPPHWQCKVMWCPSYHLLDLS